MVTMSRAVSFVVAAIGVLFIALKISGMKTMQKPEAPDWSNQRNETFQALFSFWFLCLLFEIRYWLGWDQLLGYQSNQSVTSQRLLFPHFWQLHRDECLRSTLLYWCCLSKKTHLSVESTGSCCLFSPLKNSTDGARAVPESNRCPTLIAKTRHHQC